MSSGTRRSSECPIFGSPKNISKRCLPTYEEVMKYYIYVRLQIKQRKNPSFNAIAAVVAQRLQILWKKASIPHLSRKRITSMLSQYRHKMNKLLKSKNNDNYKRKVQLLRDSALKNLFDTSACKCLDFEQTKKSSSLCWAWLLVWPKIGSSHGDCLIAELDKASTILNNKETKGGRKELNSFIIYLCVVKLSATPAKQWF